MWLVFTGDVFVGLFIPKSWAQTVGAYFFMLLLSSFFFLKKWKVHCSHSDICEEIVSKTYYLILLVSSFIITVICPIDCLEDLILGSLHMQHFWATDGNPKWTFRMSGQWWLPDFKLMVSTSEKKLSNINGVVWRQVK